MRAMRSPARKLVIEVVEEYGMQGALSELEASGAIEASSAPVCGGGEKEVSCSVMGYRPSPSKPSTERLAAQSIGRGNDADGGAA